MLETLDLNGTWKLRWSDGQRHRLEHAERDPVFDHHRWMDATVPGEVHLDAMRAGLIADPFVGTNVLAARWVEENWWTYRRTFDLPSLPTGRAWLVFDRLDLTATIFLNGVQIGRHDNFFYPCRIDVTGKLRQGSNVILVHLDPGLFGVSDKPAQDWTHWPDQLLNKRHWLRKPQFQFGWDWAPRLINCGIQGDVRLEWTDAPARADQFVALATLSDDLSHGTLRGRWFVQNLTDQPQRARLTIELPEANARASAEVELAVGTSPIEAQVELPNPELWWPVGQGAQRLYEVRATLEVGGQSIARTQEQVGFRRVRVIQDPHPQGGRYFNLEINNRRVFARGSNWVPADQILVRIDRPRYEKLIELALEENFNFLRVWGGGLYESDDFYELCDRRGILVWQEFIFACSRYPTHDQTFHENCQAEAAWNVRRLASHPSLIVWCGNNEIEWGDWDWDYGRRGAIMPDHAFFHVTLPRLVEREDGTRHYHPSSPFSLDHQHPNSDQTGDQHPWSVGFFSTEFRRYRQMVCRFADEGGMLGPTSLPTIRECLRGAEAKVGSFPWQVHDNSCITWTEPSVFDQWISKLVGRDGCELPLEEFVYWAGLLQGEALCEYVDNFRRRMFDSGAAVFWMFNDCWPATRSWTTVDYHLRRTPAFHPVRRAMAPVHVVLAETGGGGITVFGINDSAEAVEAELNYGVLRFAGADAKREHVRAALPPNRSTPLATFSANDAFDPADAAPFALLRRAGRVIARNRLFLRDLHELRMPRADVRVELREGKATFRCDSFAWGVCLDLDGERRLADNFFDVFPGEAHVIAWPFDDPPQVLRTGNLG